VRGALAIALCLAAAPLAADDIAATDYAALLGRATGIIRFDDFPARPEPGHALDHGIAFAGGRIGSGFLGQTTSAAGPFDRLHGSPAAPLALLTGPAGAGLSVAYHRGFGSMALFPVGPAGFPALEARGEGSVAILFEQETCAVGLLVHTGYADNLGAGGIETGSVTLTAYARDGTQLGRIRRHAGTGVSAHAVAIGGEIARVAGVTVENDDPGGIALDDIAFGTCAQVLG